MKYNKPIGFFSKIKIMAILLITWPSIVYKFIEKEENVSTEDDKKCIDEIAAYAMISDLIVLSLASKQICDIAIYLFNQANSLLPF